MAAPATARRVLQHIGMGEAKAASARSPMAWDSVVRRKAKPSWAVFGSAAFLETAVKAARSAGHSVSAISLAPERGSGDPIRARIKAQDQQDQLVVALGVPLGVAPDRLHSYMGIQEVLGEEESVAGTFIAKDLMKSGKTFVSAPAPKDACDLLTILKSWE